MSELLNRDIVANFRWREIVCPCCQGIRLLELVDGHMERLQELRNRLEFPLQITSGYRCPAHNREVGGAPRSMHKEFATDVRPYRNVAGQLALLRDTVAAMDWGGVGLYNTFIHLDRRDFLGRRKSRWDERT